MHPKFNLLVIEEEELALQSITTTAQRFGHHVVKAEGCELPVVMMNTWHQFIQVVVFDWTLSCNHYGGQLIQTLHQIDPAAPFIIVSGFEEKDIHPFLPPTARCFFLLKPFLPFEFENVLRCSCPKILR